MARKAAPVKPERAGEYRGGAAEAAEALRFATIQNAKDQMRVAAAAAKEDRLREADATPAPSHAWEDFPTAALPAAIETFVYEAAEAIGCDPTFIIMALLPALGTAIGTTRRIQLKPGWTEPPVIWTANICESGTAKSPGQETGLQFTQTRQHRAFADHARALDHWQSAQDAGQQAARPAPPPRYLLQDTTLEAIPDLLEKNTRGLFLCPDELNTWLGSFGLYKGGRGADVGHYLTMHRAGQLCVDRKTGDKRTIFVHQAFLGINGTIQPGTFRAKATPEFFQAGLIARMLLAMPPRGRRVWTEAVVRPETLAAMHVLFDYLWALQPQASDDGPAPVILPLTPSGKKSWLAFFEDHNEEANHLTGNLAAAWAKHEAYCARLALILHFCRLGLGDGELEDDAAVDWISIDVAREMVEWFGNEAKRIYAWLAQAPAQDAFSNFLEWAGRAAPFTERDCMRTFPSSFPKAKVAEAFLARLVSLGYLRPVPKTPGPEGGRGTTVYYLS